MRHHSSLVRRQRPRSTRAHFHDGTSPGRRVVRTVGPGLQRLPQCLVVVSVGDRLHATVPPPALNVVTASLVEREQAVGRLPAGAVETLEQVLYGRVLRPIAEKHDRMALKELSDEHGGPSLREVRASQVRAAQDVVVRVGFGIGQPTMEVGDARRWNSVSQVGVHRWPVHQLRPLAPAPTRRGGQSSW